MVHGVVDVCFRLLLVLAPKRVGRKEQPQLWSTIRVHGELPAEIAKLVAVPCMLRFS